MKNPLRHCVSDDTAEVMDRILGPFLESCIGKNDLSIANGLVVSAAIIIVTHCQRTNDNIEEIAKLFHESFDLTLKALSEKEP